MLGDRVRCCSGRGRGLDEIQEVRRAQHTGQGFSDTLLEAFAIRAQGFPQPVVGVDLFTGRWPPERTVHEFLDHFPAVHRFCAAVLRRDKNVLLTGRRPFTHVAAFEFHRLDDDGRAIDRLVCRHGVIPDTHDDHGGDVLFLRVVDRDGEILQPAAKLYGLELVQGADDFDRALKGFEVLAMVEPLADAGPEVGMRFILGVRPGHFHAQHEIAFHREIPQVQF